MPARARRRGIPLAVTITLTLIVKVIILCMLHQAFFSAPQARKMRMPTQQVEQHLLSTPAIPISKASHDAH